MISLYPITKENWQHAFFLEVHENQKKFIAPNSYSLAEWRFLDNFQAKGIYLDNKMIGFILFGIDEEDREYWIYRFMIDQHYQGKGYGKKAMQLLLKEIQTIKQPHHQTVTLSYEPENHLARHFYEKVGFQEVDGLILDGEQVARFYY